MQKKRLLADSSLSVIIDQLQLHNIIYNLIGKVPSLSFLKGTYKENKPLYLGFFSSWLGYTQNGYPPIVPQYISMYIGGERKTPTLIYRDSTMKNRAFRATIVKRTRLTHSPSPPLPKCLKNSL